MFHGAAPLMLATVSVDVAGARNNPPPIAQNVRFGSKKRDAGYTARGRGMSASLPIATKWMPSRERTRFAKSRSAVKFHSIR